MSDGEGPSAGEGQRYIYPPWLLLQSQGRRSPRAWGPAGCRQLWGWTLLHQPYARGLQPTWGGVTFQANFSHTLASRRLGQEAMPSQTLPTLRGGWGAGDPQGTGTWTGTEPQGGPACPGHPYHVQRNVCEHLSGGQPGMSPGFPMSLSPRCPPWAPRSSRLEMARDQRVL